VSGTEACSIERELHVPSQVVVVQVLHDLEQQLAAAVAPALARGAAAVHVDVRPPGCGCAC